MQPNQSEKKLSKKMILLASATVILVVGLSIGIALYFKSATTPVSKNATTNPTSLSNDATTAYNQGDDAFSKNDFATAKAAYTKALSIYKQLKDRNNIKNASAKLSIATRSLSTQSAKPTQPPAATKAS